MKVGSAALSTLLFLHLTSGFLALQLNGDTGRHEAGSGLSQNNKIPNKPGSGKVVWSPPAIPMWNFLPESNNNNIKEPMTGGQKKERSLFQENRVEDDGNARSNDITGTGGNEVTDEGEDLSISSLLATRGFNNFKRSSVAYADSFQKIDVKRSRPYDVPQIGE